MHRMIANLLNNELKHLAPASNVLVSLQSEGKTLRLTFEDNGNGFDPEILERLFVHRAKRKASTGHGPGLAFVDAVVRAHSGTIEAINRESGCARIAVCLPVASEKAGQQVTTAAQVARPCRANTDLKLESHRKCPNNSSLYQ